MDEACVSCKLFGHTGILPGGHAARILVLDPQPIVYAGLRQLLGEQEDLRVEWHARTIDQAVAICAHDAPDLSIVEITFSGSPSLEGITAMRERRPAIRILVLSVEDETLYAHRALRAGARGYVMKSEPTTTIVEAAQYVMRGHLYTSERVSTLVLESLAARDDAAIADAVGRFSTRELEVFRLISEGLKKGEIALRMRRSVNTVETHRMSLKKKLNVNSSTDLARLAFLHFQNSPRTSSQM